MKRLFVDVQTYGGEDVARVGVYCYSERYDFRGLLLGYAMDDGPVHIVDIAHGETIPGEIRKALFDPGVAKYAMNARYARICLSRLLRLPMNVFLPADHWRCLHAHLSYNGLPANRFDRIPGVNSSKYQEMQEVVRTFCLPARYESCTDYLARMKTSSFHWQNFREYVRESVVLTRDLSKALAQTPMPQSEWDCYALNERINDIGVCVDRGFVRSAIACDRQYRRNYLDLLYTLTGMEYASAENFREWLRTQGIDAPSLSGDALRYYRLTASTDVREALEIWRFLSMTSTQKYQRIARALCRDGRLRGLFVYGSRNGKFGSGIFQSDNLPVSRLSELNHIRHRIRTGDISDLESRCGSVYDALSGLLSTAFVPDIGCHLISAEYVALESCVLHWLSGLCGHRDKINAAEALARKIESAVADCFGKTGVAMAGNVKFQLNAGNLMMQLPSGRVQTYWNVEPFYDCDGRLLVICDRWDGKGRSTRDEIHAFQKKKRVQAAAAARKGESTASAGGFVDSANSVFSIPKKAKQAAQTFFSEHKGTIIGFGVLGILFVLIAVSVSSCAAAVQGGGTTIIETTYSSLDEDIYAAENAYCALEDVLNAQINAFERTHPGYDEYNYQIDEIGHNPYHLISYLQVKYGGFVYNAEIEAELNSLFSQQYRLAVSETSETRTRMETVIEQRTVIDPQTGEVTVVDVEVEQEVEYEHRIIYAVLTNKYLDMLARNSLTAEQAILYDALNRTYGNRPYLFDLNFIDSGGSAGINYTIPPEALSDEKFRNMIIEAEKYLGYPYVWGGKSPRTSFDCSGFVCWVINHCANDWDVGQKRAKELCRMCIYVSPSEARPGDLIFFEKTYDTDGASHVGIYVGDGVMLHCGNPIKYSNINTRYYKEHFLCFGRLPFYDD